MTHTQKIIRGIRKSGKTVDPNVVKGLKEIEKLHNLIKNAKCSPSKVLEQMHNHD